MAYGNQSPSGENLYDDGPEAGGAPAAADQETQGGETALIPKSLCPGMKPGDSLTLRIERVHGDQYEVSYPKEEEAEAPPEPAAAPEGGGDAEMAGMMQ